MSTCEGNTHEKRHVANKEACSLGVHGYFARKDAHPPQGYLAPKKTPTRLGLPLVPRHRATVGSYGGAVSYARGTPVCTSDETPREAVHRPFKVVLQKSIPAQIRQLILYISNSKGQVDEFVGELTSAKNGLQNTLRER